MIPPVPVLVQEVDLSAAPADLFAEGDSDQWEWGTFEDPPGGSGWATGLARPYRHNAEDTLWWAIAPSGVDRWVSLDHAYAVAPGDVAEVVGEGPEWARQRLSAAYGYPTVDGFVGQRLGGQQEWIRVPPGVERVGFRLTTDAATSDRGWFLSRLALWEGDPVPPLLEVLEAPQDTQDLEGPYRVVLQGLDQDLPPSVEVIWSASDGGGGVLPALDLGDGTFLAEIAGQGPDTQLSWHAVASDGSTTTRAPLEGELSFRTFLAAPTGLVRLGQERVAQRVVLDWEPPDSPHPVLGYEVSGSALAAPVVVGEPPVEVALASPGVLVVRASYPEGWGDPSAPLALEVEVPTLDAVSPSLVYPGEALQLALELGSTYLLAGEVQVDAGPGLEVVAIEVLDVSRALLDVQVQAAAAPGERDMTINTPQVTALFPAALRVGDPQDAPRVLDLAPAEVVQGAQVRVELSATVPLDAQTRVIGDEDLLVLGTELLSSGRLGVVLDVDLRARTGPHRLTVQAGGRLLQAELAVTARPAVVLTNCRSVQSPLAPAVGLLAALLLRRRPRRSP